jgi:hypothetical protein
VSFAEDVIGVLPFLRTQAESLMIDACTVRRLGEPATDPDTGNVTPSLTVVYSGPCKVQQTLSQASNPSAGGHQFTVQDVRWDTPVSAGPFMVDDVVTMTSCALDPQLVGRVFRVIETFHKSGATAQRTRVSEVVA